MRSRDLVLAVALLLPVAAGCSTKTSDLDLRYLNPFQAIEKTNATPGLFEHDVRTAWVDPRTPEQYAAEHIPGAISLPFPRIPSEAATVLKGYDQFVVYDTDYDDTIGKAAAKRLMEEGFKDVFSLEGGLKAWKRDGNPVEKSANAPAPAPAKGAAAAAKAPPAPTAPTAPTKAAPAAAPTAPTTTPIPAPAASPAPGAPAAPKPAVPPAPAPAPAAPPR